MNNTKKGFTLVELLVVIAILAILATVSVVGYTSFINRAHESNAQTEAHQIATSIESSLIVPGDEYEITTGWVAKKADGVITIYAADGTTKLATTATVGLETSTGDFKGLKGTLGFKTEGGKTYLTYTLESVTVNVLEVTQ